MSAAAYFFDLDGTLVDTEVVWLEAIRRAMAERGVELDQPAVVNLVYGKSWADIFAEITHTWPGLWRNIEEMQPRTEAHYLDLRQTRDITLHPSVDLLRRLGVEHTIAIVSGSTNANIAEHVAELDLHDYVDFHLGCESYSPGKPDPRCYLMAAEQAKVDPAACVVFEDSWAGVTAAKAAGMLCVAIKRPGAPDQDVSAADLVVPDLGQFEVHLLKP